MHNQELYWIDPTNGNVQFLNVLSDAFIRRHHRVVVRSNLIPQFPPPEGLIWQKFSIYNPNLGKKSFFSKAIFGFFYLVDWIRAALYLAKQKRHVVVVSSRLVLPEFDAIGLRLLRHFGIIPIIISHRPQSDYFERNSIYYAKRHRAFFDLAERILVMSDYNLQLSVQYLGLSANKFVKVPIPHFNEYLENTMPDYELITKLKSISAGGPIISILSQDTPEHGLENFFNGLPFLRPLAPDASIMVFSRIPDKIRLTAFTNKLKESFDGKYYLHTESYTYSELISLIHCTSVAVLPYNWMTQSHVAALLTGFGIPIVTTSVGGMPEMVLPGKTGEVVPPNPKSIISAIVKIIQSGKLAEYRSNALIWSQEAFNPNTTVNQIAKVLQDYQA